MVNAKTLEEVPNAISQQAFDDGVGDVFSLRDLLEAAGFDLDEPLSSVFKSPPNPAACNRRENPCKPEHEQTARYDGIVIQVNLFFDGEVNKYEYRVLPVTPQYSEPRYSEEGSGGSGDYVNYSFKGVKLVFAFTGTIINHDAWVTVQNLIIQLAAGLGLLSIAKTIVSFLMYKVLPNKKKYELFTKEYTPDFNSTDPEEMHTLDLELTALAMKDARLLNKNETKLKQPLSEVAAQHKALAKDEARKLDEIASQAGPGGAGSKAMSQDAVSL